MNRKDSAHKRNRCITGSFHDNDIEGLNEVQKKDPIHPPSHSELIVWFSRAMTDRVNQGQEDLLALYEKYGKSPLGFGGATQ